MHFDKLKMISDRAKIVKIFIKEKFNEGEFNLIADKVNYNSVTEYLFISMTDKCCIPSNVLI